MYAHVPSHGTRRSEDLRLRFPGRRRENVPQPLWRKSALDFWREAPVTDILDIYIFENAVRFTISETLISRVTSKRTREFLFHIFIIYIIYVCCLCIYLFTYFPEIYSYVCLNRYTCSREIRMTFIYTWVILKFHLFIERTHNFTIHNYYKRLLLTTWWQEILSEHAGNVLIFNKWYTTIFTLSFFAYK